MNISYEAGGIGSLGPAGIWGFLRRVTTPTTIGMAIRIRDPHRKITPIVVAAAGSLLPPTLMSAPGTILAKTEVAQKKHKNRPGQPHNNVEAMVAIMPVFLLFIFFSLVLMSVYS